MSAPGARHCVSCGRALAWEANVCPYCGHDYRRAPAYQQEYKRIGTGTRILVYLVSFFIPLLGIIIGIIFIATGDSPDSSHVGKMCILLAILPLLILVVCFALGAITSLLFW